MTSFDIKLSYLWNVSVWNKHNNHHTHTHAQLQATQIRQKWKHHKNNTQHSDKGNRLHSTITNRHMSTMCLQRLRCAYSVYDVLTVSTMCLQCLRCVSTMCLQRLRRWHVLAKINTYLFNMRGGIRRGEDVLEEERRY